MSLSPFSDHGDKRFSMKKTGRMMAYDGKPRDLTVSSIRDLLSKCGMPVFLSAEPTEA
jgi:hypothetical protein